jgi:outer membrane protein TolC
LGAAPGTYDEFVTAKFGVRYNLSAGISASQLLFSSDYLIGLQASKVYTDLAKKDITRNRIDVISNVSKAYYRAMVNQQNLKVLDINIERLKLLRDQTKAMFEAGFVESTDVDRVDLLYNNLITEKEKVIRLFVLSDALLKFQMGYDINKTIVVSDSLDINNLPSSNIVEIGKSNPTARIEYQTIENSIKLQELDLKRNRYSLLPTVALYSSLSANNLRNEFRDINWSNRWFPTGLIGITVNQPIFSGFQKKYKTDQVAINLQKSQNNLKQFESAVNLEIQNTATTYNNAIQNLQMQQKNLQLAEKIYNSSKAKFDQGSISGLDLFVSLTTLKESQNNLYTAIFDVLNSKIDYDKALGNIK